jgi:cellulose synthase/poly-beta-1,6-N-acetylglucosamine synthase-like glycosyltransferase
MDGFPIEAGVSSTAWQSPPQTERVNWTFQSPASKSPALFVMVAVTWVAALGWFHPRLWSLMSLADTWWAAASIGYFVTFAELAWLYGIYNVAIVVLAGVYHYSHRRDFLSTTQAMQLTPSKAPVAVLYTTCNDFVERSALSCVNLDYPAFLVYLLDDSSDADIRARIDHFAAKHRDRVRVVRRPIRTGMKAGNLNHALANFAKEPYFAIVDADEVLPRDFLAKLAPRLEADPGCAFVQANHIAQTNNTTRLARDMGIGVDIHWRWYQPLRNRYGFVMFLGHGALLRRSSWEHVGGFPELVSEDLAYALALREKGYYGFFADDVVCIEEFPESVRAFRVRHAKWTRGTCEFLVNWTGRLLRARRITLAEKLDVLFPTLNLPLSALFFIFMLNAQFVLPLVFGEFRPLTLDLPGRSITIPVLTLREELNVLYGSDFYAITLATIVAPVLCFVVALARTPLRLLRFLAQSTALYAALSPLSFINVMGFAATRKARFLVTGDNANNSATPTGPSLRSRLAGFFAETHPDSALVRAFEVVAGLVFATAAVVSWQVGFLGVALGFLLLPAMHSLGWEHRLVRTVVWVPFTLMVLGIGLGGLGILGLQPVFFGLGFHF